MKEFILDLEESLRLAMLESNLEELDRLISPELLFTNHLGIQISKAADLDAHEKRLFEFHSIELSGFQILPLGNAAVVSVQADIVGEYQGQATSGRFRFTRTWSNSSGDWQVIAAHSSLVA